MKTARDFELDCRRLRQHLIEVLPAKLGASMLEETRTNFRNESYGNDDVRERWPERRYEGKLTYPKLRYTGRLFRSIQPKVHRISSRAAVVALGSRKGKYYYLFSRQTFTALKPLSPRSRSNVTISFTEISSTTLFT